MPPVIVTLLTLPKNEVPAITMLVPVISAPTDKFPLTVSESVSELYVNPASPASVPPALNCTSDVTPPGLF